MPMRRYLGVMIATAAGAFLVIWAWVALMPLAYLDPEYPFWLAKRQLLERCDLGAVVILGDSRAATGIRPVLLPVPATNLAVGGGQPVEALAALRRMLACPDRPRLVILSFDPGHLMKPDLLWERSVRYGFLTGPDLAELAELSAATGDWSVHEAHRRDGLPPALRSLLYRVRLPPFYFNSVLKGGIGLRWWTNRAALDQGLAERGQYHFGIADGSDGIAGDAALAAFTPSPVLAAAFDRLLSRLAAAGIEVWFVPMPVNDATWRAMRPGVAAAFRAWLTARPGLRLVEPAAPYWPDRWFGDGFAHLNPAGTAQFTRRLGILLVGEPALSAAAGGPAEHAE